MEEVVYAPRVKPISETLQQAQRNAVFPDSFNIDLAIDALYGAVWDKELIRFETVSRGEIKKLVPQTLDATLAQQPSETELST